MKMKKTVAVTLAAIMLIIVPLQVNFPAFNLFGFGSMKASAEDASYVNPYVTATLKTAADVEIGSYATTFTDADTTIAITSVDDLLSLAAFSKTNDCLGKTITIDDKNAYTLPADFPGIGDSAHPFKGTISSLYSGLVPINLKGASGLFNCLSSTANISNISLSSAASADKSLSSGSFADTLVADSASMSMSGIYLSGSIVNFADNFDCGAIANTIISGNSNALSFDLAGITFASDLNITNNCGNAGLFFGSVNAVALTLTNADNAALTFGSAFGVTAVKGSAGMLVGLITGDGTNDGSLTSSLNMSFDSALAENITALRFVSGSNDVGGNAGAVVGCLMGSTGGNMLTLSGTISVNNQKIGGGNSVGGIIGYCSNAKASVTNAAVSSTSVLQGGSSVGGIAGTLINYNGTYVASSTLDFQSTAVPTNDSAFGKVAAGGLFGSIIYNKTSAFALDLSAATASPVKCTFSSVESGTSAFSASNSRENICAGGLVGIYSASSLEDSLTIIGGGVADADADCVQSALTYPSNSGVYAYGGIIGYIGENSFCSVSNIKENTSNTVAGTSNAGDIYTNNFGGIAAAVSDGALLDLNNITVNGGLCAKFTNAVAGGIIGRTGKGTAVRMSGAVKLGSNTYGNTASGYATYSGQLVGFQDNSLIFAESGFAFARNNGTNNTQYRMDNIGNYGEVYRNFAISNIINFNSATHEITLESLANTTISSVSDYAKLAITLNTRGYFSAFSSINAKTNANAYKSLLSSAITLGGSISLVGTGVTCLTRYDTADDEFTGTFNGGANTLTLSIGDSFADSQNGAYGNGEVYGHQYLGMFGAVNGATFNNLTVSGNINCGQFDNVTTRLTNDRAIYVGGVSGKGSGSVKFENVTTNIIITEKNAHSTGGGTSYGYYGGFIGNYSSSTSSAPTLTGCTGNAQITVSAKTAVNPYITGGMFGFASFTKAAAFNCTDTVLSGSISSSASTSTLDDSFAGGFIGQMNSTSANPDDVVITFDNIDITQSMPTKASKTCGGLIGYSLINVKVVMNSSKDVNSINGSIINSGMANFGGLFYKIDGGLSVKKTELAGTYTGRHNNTAISDGLFVCQGSNLYMTIDSTSSVLSSVAVTEANGAYCDDLVGNNFVSGKANEYGGVVSIENSATVGSAATSWTYSSSDRKINVNARYYYNVEALDKDNGSTVYTNVNAKNITSREELLLWHLQKYTSQSPRVIYFFTKGSAGSGTSYSITSNLDLSGSFCLYPTSSTVVAAFDFGNHTVTFNNAAVSGLVTDTDTSQHYLMQTGIFYNVTAGLTVSNLVLAGNVGMYADAFGNNSGALITGTAAGSHVGTTSYSPIDINTTNITFDKLKVNGCDSSNKQYAPLFINKLSTCVSANIDSVKYVYDAANPEYKIASSLIGDVGYINANDTTDYGTHLNLKFSNMLLEGKSSVSAFYKASFLNSFVYGSDGSSSGVYNFNLEDDWNTTATPHTPYNATYGYELYGDETEYLNDSSFVHPNTYKSTSKYDFTADYLPYVAFTTAAKDNGSINVNIKGGDLVKGCGTYEDPYIIENTQQFVNVNNYINLGSLTNGWRVNYPNDTTAVCDGTGHTEFTSDGTTFKDSSGNDKAELNQSWFAHAYYSIVSDAVSLPQDFVGFGNDTTPFAGVIIGHGHTVTLNVKEDKIPQYGFVNVGAGCVVKDLTLVYSGNISINDPGTSTSNIYYFGGVIGKVIGGDNIIDNVEVNSVIDKTTYNNVHVTANSPVTYIGGYVGLDMAGGVVFRNMSGKPGAVVADSSSNEVQTADSTYFYANPFVGRVLDGYAVVESTTANETGAAMANVLDNTDKNYQIPTLSNGSNKYVSVNVTQSYLCNVTISGAEGMMALSAALNSGSLSVSENNAYKGETRVRNAVYSSVGTKAASDDRTIAVTDNSVITYSSTNPMAAYIFAKYFANSSVGSKQIAASGAKDYITISADCDLSLYKNGFRGLGSKYSTPSNNNQTANDRSIIVFASFDGGSKKVTMQTKLKQYSVDANNKEQYSATELGLIRGRGTSDKAKISNVIICGELAMTLYNTEGSQVTTKICSNYSNSVINVGGIMGLVSTQSFIINNDSAENLTVTSIDAAGGLIGRNDKVLTITDCTYNNLTVLGGSGVGGFIGVISNKVTIDGTVAATAENGTITNTCSNVEAGSRFGTGGLVGVIRSSTTTISQIISLNNINVSISQSCNDWRYGSGGAVGVKLTDATLNISNVAIENSKICGSKLADKTTIAEILNNNPTSPPSGSNSNYGDAGGIVGSFGDNTTKVNADSISNCSVQGTDIICYNSAGGIVGDYRKGSLTISDCNVGTTSAVNVATTGRAGGILGYWLSNIELSNVNVGCSNARTVIQGTHGNDSNSSIAGGLLGACNSTNNTVKITNGTVTNCSVIADLYTGGVIGRTEKCTILTLSDVAVIDNDIIVTAFTDQINRYSAGIVSADDSASVSYCQNITISGCKILGENNSSPKVGGISYAVNGIMYMSNVLQNNVTLGTLTAPALANIQNNTVSHNDITATAIPACSLWVSTIKHENSLFITAASKQNMTEKYKECGVSTAVIVYADYGGGAAEGKNVPLNPSKQWSSDNFWYSDGVSDNMPGTIFDDNSSTKRYDQYTSSLITAENKAEFLCQLKTAETGVTVSAPAEVENMPVLYVKGDNINNLISEYLNLLTNGGFGQMQSVAPDNISVSAQTYNVNSSAVTAKTGSTGSVKYESNSFNSAQNYDKLSADGGTFTVLTVSYKNPVDSTDTTSAYSMQVALYYPQFLNVQTNVSVTDHEEYQISQFVENPQNNINISNRGTFTGYFEYVYNDLRLSDNWNYDKYIDVSASSDTEIKALPTDSVITLIDLNSASSKGYRAFYYKHEAADDMSKIKFSSFFDADGNNFYENITTLDNLPSYDTKAFPTMFAPEQGESTKGYGVERYLVVVEFPQLTGINYYKINAGIDTAVGIKKNVSLKQTLSDKATVTVWNEPEVSVDLIQSGNTKISGTNPIDAKFNVNVTFPSNYYTFVGSTNSSYGVTRYYLTDENNARIQIPSGTAITIGDKSYTVASNTSYYDSVLVDSSGNPINLSNSTDAFALTNQSVRLDFSGVDSSTLSSVFETGKKYFLNAEFYVTTDYNNPKISTATSDKIELQTDFDASLSVVVDGDSQLHLGINPLDDIDSTNDGNIKYNVIINVSHFSQTDIDNLLKGSITLNFDLAKKGADNAYVSVGDMSKYLNGSVTSVTLSPGEYQYDSDKKQITISREISVKTDVSLDSFANYKFSVTSNIAGNNLTDYFIYTLAKIYPEFLDASN